MAVFCKTEALKRALEALPQVVSVDGIKVEDNIINYISIETRAIGRVTVHQLDVNDASRLFEFYSEGLSEKPRRLFAPYPLFQTPPGFTDELARRISNWKRENDWSAVNLVQDGRVIGFGLLKRFRTEQVTSAIAIRDAFLKRGLGHLLQQIIIEQARLLNLKRFHIKVVSDNLASVRLHEKCGFRRTRILPPPLYEEMLKYLSDSDRKNGAEAVDRRIIEMVIELETKTEMNKSLSIKDFTEAFGADEGEVARYCGELLETIDFRYKECSPETRERIFLDVIKKCDNAKLSVSGSHRLNDWRAGWGEILQEFHTSGGDLKILVPKDLHPNRPLRHNGNYIIPFSSSFEHDFALVFRYWLFKKYCRDYNNIYEFGCGTGQNLAVMAELFPEKRLFGMDWVPESQELLKAVVEKHGWQIEGRRFDFFDPDYELEILPNSLVYTSSAMEQLGGDYGSFLSYLLAKKPSLCVNVECTQEYYDENMLYDYVALRYHKTRNYLDGFLTRLRELEKDKAIKIIATRRTGFGSLYHEGYMYVIWKIL